MKARNKQLLIGGLGLFGLLILSGWIYQLFRQKKKANELLGEKNEVIRESLKEKEALLREIHHRVKNNLQIISSLLSLQSRAVDDPTALDALQEGRSRVQSMALIHQNLYQDENLVGVHLKNYLSHLTESLKNTYAVNPEKIDLIMDIENIQLDVDTIIPLGLIINELISNALKYAFKSNENGKIWLTVRKDQENNMQVTLKDNGGGLPSDFNPKDQKSLGYRLIQIFSQKLDATLHITSDEGTAVSILVPLKKSA